MRVSPFLASLAALLVTLAAPAQQSLSATPTTVAWGYYWSKAKPVLTLHSGETVRVHTLSTCGPPERLKSLGVTEIPPEVAAIYDAKDIDKGPGGHILTGPIAIAEAEPGDVLEVRIEKIDIDVPWACNGFSAGRGYLPDDYPYGKMSLIPLDRVALVDQRWIVIGSEGPVHAVTGIRDIHVVPLDERTKVYPRDSLFLDIGAKDAAAAAAMGVEPGDPVVPDSPFVVMNGSDNYLGKAWDDRIGCAVVIEAMERIAKLPHANQLFFAATTQEEIGLRGARTAAQVVKPDIGLAIEGGIAGDTYAGHPEETQAKLGAGPGIFLYDSSALPNRKLVALVKEKAKDKSIPLQLDVVQGYGDDSAEMQESNGGTPTVNFVVPVRYTHAHNGIVNRKDFDGMVDLMVAVLQRLDQKTVDAVRDFTPGR